MNKLELNNKIVSCRPAVRQARVRSIRKKIKKLKLLQTSKREDLKEKKARKAQRLLETIQIMRKVRDDDVIRFAIQYDESELKKFLIETPLNEYEHIYAALALHTSVQTALKPFREVKTELIKSLLETLGERTMMKRIGVSAKSSYNEIAPSTAKEDNVKPEREKPKDTEKNKMVDEGLPKTESPEKVVDSFFIGKKIIAPKLKTVVDDEKANNENEIRFDKRASKKVIFDKARRSTKYEERTRPPSNKNQLIPKEMKETAKLHPSWAAKRVQNVVPFEGKKIKFDE